MDVKRALRAAQDNLTKAEELLDIIIKHNPASNVKRRLVSYGNENTKATAQEIFNQAKKPHIEEQIVITISDELHDSLERASSTLEMEAIDIAQKALKEWLSEQGF